jgi:phage-related holin
MRYLAWVLIALAAIAFILAVASALFHSAIVRVTAEGYSRASANLALIAIALLLVRRHGRKEV